MDMTIKVRISKTIANEYATRSVYDFIDQHGTYQLTVDQATELRDDAIHNALDVDLMPRGEQRAYSSLASNLMAALGR
jgi:hypothetical protein